VLDETKRIYEESASYIKDWKKLSTEELCEKYIDYKESDPEKSDCYLSAIICRYWYIIARTFYAQRVKLASEEDVYDWFIDGICNAMNNHVWTDPNSNLYNNKEGPEKAISVCIYSAKLNYFRGLDYDKRKVTKNSLSLQELEENSSDDYYIPTLDHSPYMQMYLYDKVRLLFDNYDYFSAFLLDAIVNVDVFSKEKESGVAELSNRKLIKHLRNINDRYVKIFSDTYKLNSDEVKKAADFIKNLTPDRMIRNINNLLFLLKHDKELIEYIKG
jgi:hypothetical protein